MKAYTDINQSKKLAEMLPKKGADHHYVRKVTDCIGNPFDGKWSTPKYGNPNSSHANYIVMGFMNFEILPCWSLAALLDNIPQVKLDSIRQSNEKLWRCLSYFKSEWNESIWYNNPVDACVEMILKLHEQKLI